MVFEVKLYILGIVIIITKLSWLSSMATSPPSIVFTVLGVSY